MAYPIDEKDAGRSDAGPAGSPLDLKLDAPGTLSPPGPIGRLVRLGWGVFLAVAANSVATATDTFTGASFPIQPFWWLGSVALISVFPYIVNIGFGVDWGAWPRRVLVGTMATWVAVNVAVLQSVWSPALGWFVVVWQLYAMAHLGGSFLLAAAVGTPGCEMRALPHLWTLITGRNTAEHYCPGHIDAIDRWERERHTGASGKTSRTEGRDAP